MILDGHIHIGPGEKSADDLAEKMAEAGVDGGVVISLPPERGPEVGATGMDGPARLEDLVAFAEGRQNWFPFYWIDPTEKDAAVQVERADAAEVSGFKVICGAHEPGDLRAMATYREIAERGKPILFHSGILWDGAPSSPYNRPAAFECLLEVDGLRFSLAHISWPWCDECIAVYGKFLNAFDRRPDLSVEMFIDVTPGTPPIYRREALTRLFTVGYDIENNVVFGSDSRANGYNADWARRWIDRDKAIYDEVGLGPEVQRKVFSENLLRFVGVKGGPIAREPQRVAE